MLNGQWLQLRRAVTVECKDLKLDCGLEMISSLFMRFIKLIIHNPFKHFGDYGNDWDRSVIFFMLVWFSSVECLNLAYIVRFPLFYCWCHWWHQGEGGFFFFFFQLFASSVGFCISSSYSHFLSQIPSLSDSKYRKKCVFLANLNVNWRILGVKQPLHFTYFWDMMHSQSLVVLNTLNILAHRDNPQLDVVPVNSGRF